MCGQSRGRHDLNSCYDCDYFGSGNYGNKKKGNSRNVLLDELTDGDDEVGGLWIGILLNLDCTHVLALCLDEWWGREGCTGRCYSKQRLHGGV